MRGLSWYGDSKGDVEMDKLIDAKTPIRIFHKEGWTLEGIPVRQTGEDLDVDLKLDFEGNRGDFGVCSVLRWNIKGVEIIK